MNVPTFSATYEGKFGNMGSMMVVIPGVWAELLKIVFNYLPLKFVW